MNFVNLGLKLLWLTFRALGKVEGLGLKSEEREEDHLGETGLLRICNHKSHPAEDWILGSCENLFIKSY